MDSKIVLILVISMLMCVLYSEQGIGGNGTCKTPHPMINVTGLHPALGGSDNYTLTMDQCSDLCSNNCSCAAAFYNQTSNLCSYATEVTESSVVPSGDRNLKAFLKFGSPSIDLTLVEDPSKKKKTSVMFVTALVMFVVMGIVCLIGMFLYFRKHGSHWLLREYGNKRTRENSGEEVLKIVANSFIRSFSLKELEEATSDFSMVVGKGGFGNVYLGKLTDQTEIAVKKMENWGQGDHEFCTEVSIIGLLYHCNLLQLRGYCADDKHRMLVYEYMPNGSLDEWLFQGKKGCKVNSHHEPLPWFTRMKILLGIARGLAYLHQECRSPIVHLDIKPENVLLDKDFVPKLSDFGFSKVMNQHSMAYSNARGTPGYMAPEWLVESTVSSKTDVYSFGMVLLEIVGGRRNHDPSKEGREDVYYPCWAMMKVSEGRARDVIDERIRDIEGGNGGVAAQADMAVKVGLCCIQKSVDMRPTMGRVVQMLEGLLPPPSCESLTSIYVYPCEGKTRGDTRSLHSTLMSINRADLDNLGNSMPTSPISFQDRW